MTTIRRIVTSQVEGGNANQDDANEIRPFGDVAFYLDTNPNPDKLTLMMFNGERTHIRSKVLQQGILFGSNADAGDDSGADTIKLIPDAVLYDQGSNQYIIVDPTDGEPGHIHLRAGGAQDASGADLFLGGELTCVRVSDTSGDVIIRTTNVGDPNITMDWRFETDGNLYFPGIGNNRIGESEPGLVISSDASVVLQSNNNGVSNEWFFNANGSIIFPDSTVQTTAFTSTPSLDYFTLNGLSYESFQTKQDATGVVEHDCSGRSIFYHTSPDTNWTVNLTNLGLAVDYATSITLIISQGGTGYYPSALQIGGDAQVINWQGNATPTPSSNRVDIVSFSIFRTSGGYTVLGQLVGF